MPLVLRTGIITGLLCFFITPQLLAATFDLRGMGTGLSSPHVLTVSGIQLTLSAGGTFNSTNTSFGIDYVTSGGYVDDPNFIDGVEALFMIFNQDVYLDSITVSHLDGQDSGKLVLKSITTMPLTNGLFDVGGIQLTSGSYNYRVVSNSPLVNGGTRGFSLDKISVRAVPEPTVLMLIFLGLVAITNRRV